jgi:adenylate kinase
VKKGMFLNKAILSPYMRIIVVTGSVGSGKTTVAKAISKKLGYWYVDANSLVDDRLRERYDKKRECYVVDVKKLNKSLIELIKQRKRQHQNSPSCKAANGVIIDSHLSHYLPKKYVDVCIVTRCDLKILEKRLKKRGYSNNKIRENLDCEIFDICLNEAEEMGHMLLVIDTTKGIKRSLSRILKKIKDGMQ